MMTSHLQQDDCDAVTRVLLAQLIQKSVPDVSATEYFKPSQLVDLIHQNTKSFGVFHPGYRAVHANGRFYAGTFAPTPQAKTLARALHLQDDPVPVTSRFSFGSGNVDDAQRGGRDGDAVLPARRHVHEPPERYEEGQRRQRRGLRRHLLHRRRLSRPSRSA